ncbi:hypothetical protein HDU86_002189 [Geranomyces michiganensis]|nr:hypothetical protein HDU86_002189 [Geranomyces michiganensis]
MAEPVKLKTKSLDEATFHAIKSVWGLPHIDLFADCSKPWAEHYCCTLKPPSKTGWIDYDGFNISWATHRLLYAHVHTKDARRVLDKVRGDATPALILVSAVPALERPDFLQWSSDNPLTLPSADSDGVQLTAFLLTGNPARADYFTRRGDPKYGLLMEHPRVRATMAAVRENYAFKASVSNVPKGNVRKAKAHSNFKDRAAATKANWADVVDDLLTPDECTYLAAPETEEEVNPDGSPRTHPLWTLATIRGFWAPVILDVGASRSLISGYKGVLYESADCAPMEEAGFSGVGGNVRANTRVSLGVSLRGKEGEYLSFRGFFCRVKMNEDVILIANDILAPLKVRLTVQLEPLPSFATMLNNPDRE